MAIIASSLSYENPTELFCRHWIDHTIAPAPHFCYCFMLNRSKQTSYNNTQRYVYILCPIQGVIHLGFREVYWTDRRVSCAWSCPGYSINRDHCQGELPPMVFHVSTMEPIVKDLTAMRNIECPNPVNYHKWCIYCTNSFSRYNSGW